MLADLLCKIPLVSSLQRKIGHSSHRFDTREVWSGRCCTDHPRDTCIHHPLGLNSDTTQTDLHDGNTHRIAHKETSLKHQPRLFVLHKRVKTIKPFPRERNLSDDVGLPENLIQFLLTLHAINAIRYGGKRTGFRFRSISMSFAAYSSKYFAH